jgi:8-oxo-dGTP diphosphatase
MITVICGLIRNRHNQIFIARRGVHKSHAGYWEFPGGKLEADESHENCLKRELMEELGMNVKVGTHAGETTHTLSNFSIHLIAYHCEFVSATYQLSNHDRYEWVTAEALSEFSMMDSDIVISKLLMDN